MSQQANVASLMERNKAERDMRILAGRHKQAMLLLKTVQGAHSKFVCRSTHRFAYASNRSQPAFWSEGAGGICLTNVTDGPASRPGCIAFIDLKCTGSPSFFRPHSDRIADVCVSGSMGLRCATVADDGAIALTDLRSPAGLTHSARPSHRPLKCRFRSTVFTHLLVGDVDGGVSVYDTRHFVEPLQRYALPISRLDSPYINWRSFPGVAVECLEHVSDPHRRIDAALTAGVGGVNCFALQSPGAGAPEEFPGALATGADAPVQLHRPQARHSVAFNAEAKTVLVSDAARVYTHPTSDLGTVAAQYDRLVPPEAVPMPLDDDCVPPAVAPAVPAAVEEPDALRAVLVSKAPVLDVTQDLPTYACYPAPRRGVVVQSLDTGGQLQLLPTFEAVRGLQVVPWSALERCVAFMDGACLHLWKV